MCGCVTDTRHARAESGERREERSERLSHCIIITSFCFVGVCEVGVCEWAEMLCVRQAGCLTFVPNHKTPRLATLSLPPLASHYAKSHRNTRYNHTLLFSRLHIARPECVHLVLLNLRLWRPPWLLRGALLVASRCGARCRQRSWLPQMLRRVVWRDGRSSPFRRHLSLAAAHRILQVRAQLGA